MSRKKVTSVSLPEGNTSCNMSLRRRPLIRDRSSLVSSLTLGEDWNDSRDMAGRIYMGDHALEGELTLLKGDMDRTPEGDQMDVEDRVPKVGLRLPNESANKELPLKQNSDG